MEKLRYAQRICVGKAGLALQRTKALWPKCRIGVAVSGGVDSFALLKTLWLRQKIVNFPFEIMALHINPGFNPENHKGLGEWLRAAGISGHVEVSDFGPAAHSSGKKSACFLCARKRRTRLFELCKFYGLTHLAFGHTADDLLSTFLLNFWGTGRVAGMSISASFFKGELQVIRPFLLVEKKYIIQAARQWRLPVWKNDCPSAGHTARAEVEEITGIISQKIPQARKSMLNALCRWQLEMES